MMTDETVETRVALTPAQNDPLPLVSLTPQEDTFALAVIECSGNVSLAYKMAYGADAPFPLALGRELLVDPRIQARIQTIMTATGENVLISMSSHLSELADIRDTAKATGQIKVAYQAEKARGEASGFYVGKQKDSGTGVNVHINMMSPSELSELAARRMGNTSTVIDMEK